MSLLCGKKQEKSTSCSHTISYHQGFFDARQEEYHQPWYHRVATVHLKIKN